MVFCTGHIKFYSFRSCELQYRWAFVFIIALGANSFWLFRAMHHSPVSSAVTYFMVLRSFDPNGRSNIELMRCVFWYCECSGHQQRIVFSAHQHLMWSIFGWCCWCVCVVTDCCVVDVRSSHWLLIIQYAEQSALCDVCQPSNYRARGFHNQPRYAQRSLPYAQFEVEF